MTLNQKKRWAICAKLQSIIIDKDMAKPVRQSERRERERKVTNQIKTRDIGDEKSDLNVQATM